MTASNSHEETDMVMSRSEVQGLLDGCVVRSSLEGTLARSLLAAHDEMDRLRADADAAVALVVERADMSVQEVSDNCETDGERLAIMTAVDRIRALAPASGLSRLAELRGRAEKAEADLRESLAVNKRLNTWLDGDTAALVAERDTLAAEVKELQARLDAK